MKCPSCEVQLKEAERRGVKIRFCPECEGEWFCRGAVDRLLDRCDSRITRKPMVPVADRYEGREEVWNWF